MAWWIPLAIAGGSWLANTLFGKKPQAPNVNAPQYQPGIDTSAWVQSQSKSLKQQTENWLKNQMLGYRKQASGRGWTPQTSSGYTEFGDYAGEKAAGAYAQGLADIEGRAAQMAQMAKMQGMQQYGQDYQNWLAATQGQSGDFLSSLMSMLGNIDWDFGGGGSTDRYRTR